MKKGKGGREREERTGRIENSREWWCRPVIPHIHTNMGYILRFSFLKKISRCGSAIPLIPAHVRQRQRQVLLCEFQASLDYSEMLSQAGLERWLRMALHRVYTLHRCKCT